MALFCIPPHLVDKLKKSALKGEVDIAALYKMNSEGRRAFFTQHTNKELGQFINAKFEAAMVSKQKKAITHWAESVFTPKAQGKAQYKNVLNKIKELDDLGVLNENGENSFLEDLVREKLGVNLSVEEVKVMQAKAEKIQEAQEALGDDLLDPTKVEENLNFFKVKKEMDDYILSRVPAHLLKVWTGTIGRGFMLLSVKSPVLNIGSNLEVGLTEGLSRRLANWTWRGANNELAKDYVKFANKVYQQTGYDISRMMNMADTGASGKRVLEDTVHTKGEGRTRKVGQFVEDVVFKQLMGAPDVAFSSTHFADSVNLGAMAVAKGDKARATELMKDAMRLEPKTEEGGMLRQQAILDAQVATWTDSTWASKVSLGIRKLFNDVSGDVRLGDWLDPFVKTPANVVATGMDYAGGGLVKALINTVKVIRTGDIKNEAYLRKLSRDLIRSGIGFTAAAIFAMNLDDDDFVGAYDPERYQIEQLKNSNYNAIRIGGKWINVAWLGPIGTTVTGIMTAKKNSKGGSVENVFQYGKGVLSQVTQLPGVSTVKELSEKDIIRKGSTAKDNAGRLLNYMAGEVYSRLVPGGVSDIAKVFDDKQRVSDKSIGDEIKVKLPGFRNTLPVKKNIFGEDMQDENWFSNILFGARVKTDKDTPLIDEIDRVARDNDKSINFTDWLKSSNKNLAQFKERVGADTYREASAKYGQELKKQLEELTASQDYKDLSNEDKFKAIGDADTAAQEKIFSEYNFEYQGDKKPSTSRSRSGSSGRSRSR